MNEKIAIEAAEISLEKGLSMADAIIKATADVYGARVITSDRHFEGIENVEII